MALEQYSALVGAGQDGFDLVLIAPIEQSILDDAGSGVDLVTLHIMVAGHEQQPLAG